MPGEPYFTGPDAPSPTATTPELDAECRADELFAILCRFVVAATTGDLRPLAVDEQPHAREASELPKRTWTITGCDLVGDITVLCEIAYDGTPADSEPTSAGFYLQPVGGQYNPSTGGYDVPKGGRLSFEVVDYAGLGLSGTF